MLVGDGAVKMNDNAMSGQEEKGIRNVALVRKEGGTSRRIKGREGRRREEGESVKKKKKKKRKKKRRSMNNRESEKPEK